MRIRFIASTLILLALIPACDSGKNKRYLDTSLGQSLELPPDLTVAEVVSKFELPSGFNGDDASVRDKLPVLAKIDSLQLQGRDGFYWLAVDEPVDNLYQMVKNYWGYEGYRLVVDEPIIGVMQTEWIYHDEGANKANMTWWESLFAADDFSATQDQYRTRIERGPDGQANRIYIVHRGTEYKHIIETKVSENATNSNNENDWHFRRKEPELEVEMLSRLMVYLGLQQAAVDQQQASISLYAPRASTHIDVEENSPFLIVRDTYHIAWNRVYHELERLNFEIVSSQFTSFAQEGVIIVRTEISRSSEDDGIFSFFSSTEDEEKKFVLVLSEESNELTRVDIENMDGDLDTSPEGARFLDLLYQQVK